MRRPTKLQLKDALELGRPYWDHDQMRPAVRENFRKMLACGTAALGAEVYASANEKRIVYHTCKSRACPSCGYRATTLWQRDQWRDLPDTPYSHVTFTMPDVLWPLFRQNRHLLHDLPVLGAKTIEHWAWHTYGVRLMILVIPHTFGRKLNFNCHLHILVSEAGLDASGTTWRKAPLKNEALMPLWRYAVVTYLREAYSKVPPWAKDEKTAYKMINARAETITEKASFKAAVNKRRCLIPADGFYEWKMMSDGSKQPHWFHLEDRRPFSFAGIWEYNGQLDVTSCAIVTTEANGVVKPYHNRMPVILAQRDYGLWVSADTALIDTLALLRPYDGNDLAVHAVSKIVNSVKNDTTDCIAAFDLRSA